MFNHQFIKIKTDKPDTIPDGLIYLNGELSGYANTIGSDNSIQWVTPSGLILNTYEKEIVSIKLETETPSSMFLLSGYLPNGLTLNNNTISGTVDELFFDISLDKTPFVPQWNIETNHSYQVNEYINIKLNVKVKEGRDILSFYSNNIPNGMFLSADGLLTGRIFNTGIYEIKINVEDTMGAESFDIITIEVSE